MSNVAISFGAILLVLGIAGYIGSGMASPTALIPAAFGLLLLILGVMARDPKRRKMAMHIAAVVGVLGFLGSARGLVGLASILSGDTVARQNAVVAQAIMAILMLIFTVLCVRSFIQARRSGAI